VTKKEKSGERKNSGNRDLLAKVAVAKAKEYKILQHIKKRQ